MKNFEDYPLVLSVVEITEILNISKPKAYEIMESPTFPLVRIGRTKRVLKEEFFRWLSTQSSKAL